jgi:hypothetical protein
MTDKVKDAYKVVQQAEKKALQTAREDLVKLRDAMRDRSTPKALETLSGNTGPRTAVQSLLTSIDNTLGSMPSQLDGQIAQIDAQLATFEAIEGNDGVSALPTS